MTTSIAHIPSGAVPSTGPGNWIEVFKFGRLTLIWLTIIFGAVWIACWGVGELIPAVIAANFSDSPQAQAWVEIFQVLTPLIAVMVFIPINAMFMVLCERRALALFTVRKGPNRVGPDGLAQTFADALKLLFKEDITPTGADATMFTLAPIIFFAPSIFGALPLLAAVTADHPLFAITNLPTGIFYVLAMSSIPVVGLVMGGYASNNKYSLVGGLRSAAQAISYEIPLVLSLVTICTMAGTLDVVKIANMQGLTAIHAGATYHGIFDWNLFGGGALFSTHASVAGLLAAYALAACCILLCGIYMTGACAEINRIPFDLPEAESELVSGYNTEYSGIKFAIFFLAEFTNLFIVATVASVMFLGGGAPPIPGLLDAPFFTNLFAQITQSLPGDSARWLFNSLFHGATFSGALWAIIKVYSLVIFAILVRGTLPRFRIDQLMDFGWKRLIPLTLILLLLVTYLMELVHV